MTRMLQRLVRVARRFFLPDDIMERGKASEKYFSENVIKLSTSEIFQTWPPNLIVFIFLSFIIDVR